MAIHRRHFCLRSIIFLVSLGGWMTPLLSEQKPNVLLITVDDMNCDSVGAFGCGVDNITPNIDRLATEGLRFEHGHVTIAICQPTRAVWMTGRYPHRNGALGFDPITRGVPTMLEALHQNGYLTGILAKVPHVVPTRHAAFDVIVRSANLGTGRDPALYHRHALEFFERSKKDGKPFFLMANAQDPHRPFAGSAQESGRKNRKNATRIPGVSRTYRPNEIAVPGFLPDIPAVRKEIAEYFTSVHRADEVVGGVLKALSESGLDEKTLVMFVSDHGMPLPFAKTNCWRHSTRTPWIVRWPGVVKPASVDDSHFVSGIDLAPTILNAVGLKPLPGADGRSFMPLLKGETQQGREHVFTHINRTAGKREFPMRSVQNERFGYIFNAWAASGTTVFRNESQSGLTMKAMIAAAKDDPLIASRVKHFLYRQVEEFYDYQNDPDALHNLIDDPQYREETAYFRQLMLRYMQTTEDPQSKAFRELVIDTAAGDIN